MGSFYYGKMHNPKISQTIPISVIVIAIELHFSSFIITSTSLDPTDLRDIFLILFLHTLIYYSFLYSTICTSNFQILYVISLTGNKLYYQVTGRKQLHSFSRYENGDRAVSRIWIYVLNHEL